MNTRMDGGAGDCMCAHAESRTRIVMWFFRVYVLRENIISVGFIRRQTIRTLLVLSVFERACTAHYTSFKRDWALTHNVGNHILSLHSICNLVPLPFPIVSTERLPFSKCYLYDNWRLTTTTNWYAHKTRKQKCFICDVVFDLPFSFYLFRVRRVHVHWSDGVCAFDARLIVNACNPATGDAVIRFNTLWQ